MRGSKVKRLFEFDDVQAQGEFVKSTWESFPLRKAFDIILHRRVAKVLLSDPGLYFQIGPSIRPGAHLFEKISSCLSRFPAKECSLLSLLFLGKVLPEAYPPYLQMEPSQEIQKRLGRLSYATKDIVSYLAAAPDNSFDRFSLSDVASYISPQDFESLCKSVLRTAKPGARFSMRQFLSEHAIAPSLVPYFKRDRELEAELEESDRCFVYRYMVGSIVK